MSNVLSVSRENLGSYAMDQIEREFRTGFAKKRFESLRNQRLIAYQNSNTERRAIDGVGCVELELDPEIYFNWIHREGKDFWRDPKNRDWIKKRYPQTAVKSAGTKTQVGWSASCQ